MEAIVPACSQPLGELLALLSERQSTCIVRARDLGREGELCFEAGELSYVRFGTLHGGRAMLALLASRELSYEIEDYAEPVQDAEHTQEADPAQEAPTELASARSADDLASSADGVEQVIASEFQETSGNWHVPEQTDAAEVHSLAAASAFAVSADPSSERPFSVQEAQADSARGAGELRQRAVLISPVELLDPPPLALDSPQPVSESPGDGAPGREEEQTDPRLVLPSPWSSETKEAPRLLRELAEAANQDERPSLEVMPEPHDSEATPSAHSSALSAEDREAARGAIVDAGVAQWAALMLGDESIGSREAARVVRAQASQPPPAILPSRRLLTWAAVAVTVPLLLIAIIWSARTGSASSKIPPKLPATVTAAEQPERAPQLVTAKTVEVAAGAFAPTILVNVLVGVDGAVSDGKVVAPRAGLAELEARALAKVKAYRFLPALAAGKPVARRLTLPIFFAASTKASTGARELAIKGSDTIGAALAPRWARGFEATQPGLQLKLEALGTSTGFSGLFDGSAAVAMASRPVRPDELAFASKLGIQLREVTTGFDGIAVIVHRDNRLRSLDLESVARVFAGRSTRWGELGGRDAAIRVIGRPSYSGTHAFFKEKVLKSFAADADFGPRVESVESAQRIVEQVAADVDAIAYVGLGQVNATVHALALQTAAGTKPVAATAASVRDGSYPVARPLQLYFRGDSERDTRAFIDYTLSRAGQALVRESGFVALDEPVQLALASEPQVPVRAAPTLLRVYFEEASAVLTASSHLELVAAAGALRNNRRALVIGNADSSGDVAKNEQLARRRAEAVALHLKQLGIGAASLDVQVASADRPLATNVTVDGRKANRRVDLVLLER